LDNIHTSVLTDEAKRLFKTLSSSSELEGLTLIGGTALALQIKHRISLDFDFATFEKEIPFYKIDLFISRLKIEGWSINEIIDTNKTSQFKINTGLNLRNFVRDYVVNGIKLTFFAHGKNDKQRQYYSQTYKIISENMSFSIMGIDGLKTSKVLVLADRVTSRDLYDLMILIKDYSFTIDKAFNLVRKIGHLDDVEHYRAVMTGIIPLDKSDSGLLAVDVEVTILEIYEYFENIFESYDIEQARILYSKD